MVGESNAPAAEISKSSHKTLFVLFLFIISISNPGRDCTFLVANFNGEGLHRSPGCSQECSYGNRIAVPATMLSPPSDSSYLAPGEGLQMPFC